MTFPTATVFPVKIIELIKTYNVLTINYIEDSNYSCLSPSVRSVNLPSCGKSANISTHIKLFTFKTKHDHQEDIKTDWRLNMHKKQFNSTNVLIKQVRHKPECGTQQQHHSSQKALSFSLISSSWDQFAVAAQRSHTLQQQNGCARRPYSQL